MIRLTAAAIAADVRLRRTGFEGAFLLTEGSLDSRITHRELDGSAAQTVVCLGKQNVEDAIQLLEQDGVAGVVGLIDADHDRLRPTRSVSPLVVLTDEHDIEMMLLRSNSLDKVLAALGSARKMRAYENEFGSVRDGILAVSAPIGALRLISLNRGLDLKFEGLTFSRFVSRDLEVDSAAMVRAVLSNSRRADLDNATLVAEIKRVLDQGHDLWQLCHGRDVIEITSIGLRRRLGSASLVDASADRTGRLLEVGYESAAFRTTEVFGALRRWEDANAPHRLFHR